MSGYLQRLYDRASGAVEAPAPAMRPGSPLARHDQRLGIAELAADFGFGNTPNPLANEGEDTIAPLLPTPPADRGIGHGPALHPAVHDIEEAAKQTPPPSQPPAAERADDSTRPRPAAPVPHERDGPAPAEPARKAPSHIRHAVDDRRSHPSPPPSGPPQAPAHVPSPAVARSADHAPAAERETVLLRDRAVPIPTEAPPAPHPPIEEPPAPAPDDTPPEADPPRRDRPGRIAELPQARPPAQRTPEPIPAELPAIDWAEIDRRIARAIRTLAPPAPELAAALPTRSAENPRGTEEQRKPEGFITAAAASVIGPIEHSPGHRMLFGARWR